MKLSEIQELIKFVVKSGATEVTYEIKDLKLTIKAPNRHAEQQHIIMQPQAVSGPVQEDNVSVTAGNKNSAKKKEAPVSSADESKYITIKSPMIGTFYRSPAPDKLPFVNVGDSIKKGQALCIIEAMKLFNEIESEYSGKIVQVLAEDSTPVEYDHPLFLIEPK